MRRTILSLIIVILIGGCATTIPQSAQQDRADMNAAIQRFEQAKALSPADIPDIYNVSRLSKGSNVKIKHMPDGSDKAYFMTITVRDVKTNNKGKVYVVDSVVEGKTYTFSEDTTSLRKIVSPYENAQPLADFKDPEGPSLPTMAVNALGAGAIGVLLSPVSYAHTKQMNKESADYVRGMQVERKVTDFKFLADETLKVANKNILCKVYQIHSLTRQTMPATKRMPSPSFVIDASERIWVSEDVPFGVVKRESTQTLHMSMEGGTRSPMGIAPSSQTTRESSEAVEFSY